MRRDVVDFVVVADFVVVVVVVVVVDDVVAVAAAAAAVQCNAAVVAEGPVALVQVVSISSALWGVMAPCPVVYWMKAGKP